VIEESLSKREFASPMITSTSSNSTFSSGQSKRTSRSSKETSFEALSNSENPRWIIPYEQLTIGKKKQFYSYLLSQSDRIVGVGSYGEVFKGKWRGQDIAVKKLLRKRLHEDVLLDLKAECVILSDLRHPSK
jgi:hypothetical protein